MIIQWILQIFGCTVVACVIGYFLLRISTKIRIFLFRKHSNRHKKELDQAQIKMFYNQFGFYYEDVIKYAPEFDTFITKQLNPTLKDKVFIKMIKLRSIDDAIRIVDKIDILKYKQTIENIKNQKALENIDG